MTTQYGPILSSSANLRHLRELVPSADELEKVGYVLAQLSPSDVNRKRRCDRCARGERNAANSHLETLVSLTRSKL